MRDNLNSLKAPSEFLPVTHQAMKKKKKARNRNLSFSEESQASASDNFLMINGTKIYYDQEAIGGIVDISRRRTML